MTHSKMQYYLKKIEEFYHQEQTITCGMVHPGRSLKRLNVHLGEIAFYGALPFYRQLCAEYLCYPGRRPPVNALRLLFAFPFAFVFFCYFSIKRNFAIFNVISQVFL